MRDYHEKPESFSKAYSLFLIGKQDGLAPGLLDSIYQKSLPEKPILSFERIFKGSKRALVVYGPTATLLDQFKEPLGLTEVEDYSKKTEGKISAWEVGSKGNLSLEKFDLLKEVHDLKTDEQFWWQLVSQPPKSVIRAVFLSQDPQRINSFSNTLMKIGEEFGLVALPQSFTSTNMVKFYQERSLPQSSLKPLNLSNNDIQKILGI